MKYDQEYWEDLIKDKKLDRDVFFKQVEENQWIKSYTDLLTSILEEYKKIPIPFGEHEDAHEQYLKIVDALRDAENYCTHFEFFKADIFLYSEYECCFCGRRETY